MFFGAVVWDPWLIIAQIACLQCLYYLTLGLVLALLVGTRVSKMTLFYLFDFTAISASSLTGWGGYLLYLIERAKKCIDFSATLYIIHLIICISYGGWPSSFTWWIVNIAGLAAMALLGEYLCVRRELREIPITRYRPIVWLTIQNSTGKGIFSWALMMVMEEKGTNGILSLKYHEEGFSASLGPFLILFDGGLSWENYSARTRGKLGL